MKLLAELPLADTPEGGIFSAAEEPRRLSSFGDWSLVTWLHGISWEWRVLQENGWKTLEHSTEYTSALRTGDGSWSDFVLEFDIRQMRPLADTSIDEVHNTDGRVGVMFRYLTFRQTYALFLECQQRVVLYRRDDDNWITLASMEMPVDKTKYYRFKVVCKGDAIRCWMDDSPLFDVTDDTIRRGRIALYANTLGRYGSCRITADEDGSIEIGRFIASERAAIAKSAEGLPTPVLWKRIPHPPRLQPRGQIALNVSPNNRFHGVIVVTADHEYAPRDGAALVAVDASGEVKWSQPVNSRAFPGVWDLDGDGIQEVVCLDGPTIKVIDIDTGDIKTEQPTPPCNRFGNRGGREDTTPHIPGYKIYPANVRGLGPGRDLAIIDMYTGLWLLDDSLRLQWWRSVEHGHDICLYDIDGDGREEIMCGYVLFDHDGSEMWTVSGTEYLVHTHHHVDHMLIGEFEGHPNNGVEIALTCGNNGFMLADCEGRVRSHHLIGHAQALSAGRFRDDVPGKQLLVGCLWGNPGSRTLFSGSGEKLWTIEPDNTPAYDMPVRWSPGRDLFLLVSSEGAGGLYDGYGRKVIPFPDARYSTADRAMMARDFTGNGLDDFVIQGRDAIMVYTQGDV